MVMLEQVGVVDQVAGLKMSPLKLPEVAAVLAY
jgi:hypothetical protein